MKKKRAIGADIAGVRFFRVVQHGASNQKKNWPWDNFSTTDCINNGRSICNVTQWFVLKAGLWISAVAILFFLETEVTIFGKEGDAEGESCDNRG